MAKGNGATQTADAVDQQQERIDEVLASKPVSITRDLLIGAKNRPIRTKDVIIPDWGRARIRALKSNEREQLDDAAITTAKDGRISSDFRMYKARAVAMALLDPDTNAQLFSNPLGEAALLGELEAVVLDRLFYAVDELSALTRRSQEALGKELGQTGNTPS